MKAIQWLFASISRSLEIEDAETSKLSKSERDALAVNFSAVVLNGLFFPTAGKILGAGLLLTWFLMELTPSAFVVALLIPIQYGIALLAQPWIAQWFSSKQRGAPYYRGQALLRAGLWGALALVIVLTGRHNSGWLLLMFFVVVIADAVAAGLGNIAFNDTLARVIPQKLRGRARGWRGVCGALIGGAAGILIHFFVSPEKSLELFALLPASVNPVAGRWRTGDRQGWIRTRVCLSRPLRRSGGAAAALLTITLREQ
jgi:hypothetical protein